MMEEDENNKHSVYVEKYDKVYEEGQFAMNGDSLVICVTTDFDNTTQLSAKFGAQMGYVTFICLGKDSYRKIRTTFSYITVFIFWFQKYICLVVTKNTFCRKMTK